MTPDTFYSMFVDHHLVPERKAEGWTDEGPLPSPHGWYSNLMTREDPTE